MPLLYRTKHARPNVNRYCAETVAEIAKNSVDTPTVAEEKPRIIILGDSLTAGLGLDVNKAYPALVENQLG